MAIVAREILQRIARDYPQISQLSWGALADNEWNELCQLMSGIAETIRKIMRDPDTASTVTREQWQTFFAALDHDYAAADDPTKHMIELCLIESLPAKNRDEQRLCFEMLGPNLEWIYRRENQSA